MTGGRIEFEVKRAFMFNLQLEAFPARSGNAKVIIFQLLVGMLFHPPHD